MLGLGSRREVEQLIISGQVQVNGQVVRELAAQVDPAADRIVVAGRRAARVSPARIIAFYKPRGVLCTWNDERGRNCLAAFFSPRGQERVFAVGRLDRDTEGLLLITNDGKLAHALMHPSSEVPRTYEAVVMPAPGSDALEALRGTTRLPDGLVHPREVALLRSSGGRGVLRLTVCEGRNRLLRRLLAAHGFTVLRLRRTRFGTVTLRGLKPGDSRELSAPEVESLRSLADSG